MTGAPGGGASRLRELIAAYGWNTNHFLTLYDGFKLFETADGMVPYYERAFAWVGAGEPLAPRERQLALFETFVAAARGRGKAGLLIPCGSEFAERARAGGHGAVMIGHEPLFKLDSYPRTGQTWHGVVPTARQLHGKGARVRELTRAELEGGRREELQAITSEWLGTRKMGALSFLNKVEPWTCAEDKRFFVIEHQGRVSAFVAAIPIWPRQAWYLVDVLRREGTEPGTTELLLLETMRLLKEQGAREISLGVAPLANLENAPPGQPARLNRVLRWFYESGDAFYNFGSLHQFKLKFQPNAGESAFVVSGAPRLGALPAASLLSAFVPHGLAVAAASGAWRMLRHFSLSDAIRAQVAPTVVVRSAPPSVARLVYRCRVTLALMAVLVAASALTLEHGRLAHSVAAHWAYSLSALREQSVRSLVVSPFLHWNLAHLVSNLLLALVFCGLLEYLAGSLLTFGAFVLGALVANPAASALIALGWGSPNDADVGASLGILGCAGALVPMLRHGRALAVMLVVVSAASAAWLGSVQSLNHLFALGAGWLLGRVKLRS